MCSSSILLIPQLLSNLALGNPSNQLKNTKSLCLKIISYSITKYEEHEYNADVQDKSWVDKLEQQAASSEKSRSSLLNPSA